MKTNDKQSFLILNCSCLLGIIIINLSLIRNLFLKSTMSWNIHLPVYSYYGNNLTPLFLIGSILSVWAYIKHRGRYLEFINACIWCLILVVSFETQELYTWLCSAIIILFSLGRLVIQRS